MVRRLGELVCLGVGHRGPRTVVLQTSLLAGEAVSELEGK